MVVVIGALGFNRFNVRASGETSSWLSDYDYYVEDEYVVLEQYVGMAHDDIVIPAKAVIDGKEYTTVLNSKIETTSNYKIGDLFFSRNIKSVRTEEGVMLRNGAGLFHRCENLVSADLSGLDTSRCTNMSGMFRSCFKLESVDLSGFDTHNVTNMECMFEDCHKLKELDISSFDTRNVTSMFSMFYACFDLKQLKLNAKSIDTSKVNRMSYMFGYCISLESLDLSCFDTNNVTDMFQMFWQCSSLESLDISGWSIECEADLDLLSGCNKLTRIKTPKSIGGSCEEIDLPITMCTEDGTGEYNTLNTAPSNTWIVRKIDTVTMLRLYNPNSGEHFYTSSEREKNSLVKVGWSYEGIAWVGPAWSNTPVYRLYNENSGDHHYTTKAKERDNLVKVGWKDEGIGWYSDDAKAKPLYRLYNPNATTGSHHYTTSTKERDQLVKIGWNDEGIGWYGYAQ